MRNCRRIFQSSFGRVVIYALVAASLHYASDPYNYLYAIEVQRAKEAQVREIAAKLNVDPEFLLHPEGRRKFDFKSLFSWLGLSEKSTEQTTDAPLDIKESVARVKSRYALVAADTVLSKITQAISDLPAAKNKGQMKAHLQSVLRLIDKDFLPDVPEGLPGSAKSRDAQMRAAMNKLRNDARQVLKGKDALEEANLETTLAELRVVLDGQLTPKKHEPRWTKDPFPVKDAYKKAPQRELGGGTPIGGSSPATVTTLSAPTQKQQTNAAPIPTEVAALANQLATPAKIFAWVHDHIEFEPYSGVAKGSLGTYKEGRGNDWDQALLLRDLLAAKGYDARLEWGNVTLPMKQAMNLAGTEDPTQAANLLATAGFNGVVLTVGSVPVGVQMAHAWVRAFIPYIPNRGATAGTADTWVRMDPSFKRYEYQPGIKINGKVTWSEDEYLRTSTMRPPADFYGDKIWSYIRANNLNCSNLAQVAKTGRIKQENFPLVPSTLTAKIDRVDGSAVEAPADQIQSVSIAIGNVANYNVKLADVWGRKLTITFAPATPDDAAIINSYGGIFNTPAYLIKLKPVISLDDQPVAEGAPVSAGAELDLNLGFHQPNVADDSTHHDMIAGETHTLIFDAGNFPDSLIESRINRLKTLTNADQVLSEKLYLIGLRYMQHVDDGIAFAAGMRWQRAVKRVFEGDVRRQINVSYTVAGAPLRLVPAENNIDIARLLVGIVPIDNDLSNKADALQLAGLQSSYLEGAIWEEMDSQQGISAAKALLLARMAGQQIQTVTPANVNAVLASANLSSDVEDEIRGAVAQGRIARIAPNEISLGHWTGTGYILEDPTTGAATYPISGGLAGGSETNELASVVTEILGSEDWLDGTDFGEFLSAILATVAGDKASNQRPSTEQSDPVNMSTGNMHRLSADFSILGRGIPVALARTYNSRSTHNGPFGYGWTYTYGEQITMEADGSATLREHDGTEHHFALIGTAFVSPAGKHLELTRTGSGWTLDFSDGMRETFDNAGLLATQSDLNGNTVTINRDANGNPTAIVDAAGRTVLTFTLNAGKVVEATDLGGRKTLYAYDGDDLVSVTDTAGKVWTMRYDLSHNMTQHRDPVGNTQSYDYDNDDRMFHHVDALGAEEFFHYDIAALQSVVTDKRGGDRLIQYDDLGRATTEADGAGNVVRSTFDSDNNRVSLVDSRGATTSYEYDASGNMTKQANSDGGTATGTYDANSRPLTATDVTGVTVSNSYDASGNVLQTARTVGGTTETTTNVYDGNGQLTSTKDANGGETTMTWNANGTLATRTDAAGNTTTIDTDTLGRVRSIRDAANNSTTLTFDAKDRILSLTDPYAISTSFTYDDAGRRKTVSTPRGTTTYVYDAEGRVLSVTDASGKTTSTAYNAAGDVIAQTDGRGNTTRFEYDTVGRVTRTIDANGGVWQYGYCAAVGGACSTCGGGGTFCEITDPKGNTIRQEFDSMGRVTAVTDSLSHAVFTQYDKAGRKTVQTDANGNATRYGYDEAGRLVSVREANGAVTTYTYDANGNKLTQRDPLGHVWSFSYDAMNRVIGQSDPLNRTVSYVYDVLGNLKKKTDAKGQVVTYDYNVRRLTKTNYPDGSTDTFGYDSLGRVTSMANPNVTMTYNYDVMNRLTSMTNQRYGLTSTYEYDAAGNRVKMTVPRSSGVFFTVKYLYDAKNRLTSIEDSIAGMFRFGYDVMDRRTSLAYPNGLTTSYAYDNAYRLTAMATKNSSGIVADAWSYQYDAVGNRISKTNLDGKSDVYRYDSVYRLSEANYSDGAFDKFTYDNAGNRLTQTNETTTMTYSYDVANQLLNGGGDTFTYDANGNVITKANSRGTTTFTYDVNNRLKEANGPDGRETNLYAADGARVDMSGASIENGQVRVFYDPSGNPILDYGTDNQVWTYRVYGPGLDEPLAEYRRTNGRIVYLLRDGLGSVTAMTATDGRVMARYNHRAFGAESRTDLEGGANPPSRLGYTAREASVGGLMYYRARHYDPSTGRFLQQDSFGGDEMSPPSLQRYIYVYNNPVAFKDPSGNFGITDITGWILIGSAMSMIWNLVQMLRSAVDVKHASNPEEYILNPQSWLYWVLMWVEVLIVANYAGYLFGMGQTLLSPFGRQRLRSINVFPGQANNPVTRFLFGNTGAVALQVGAQIRAAGLPAVVFASCVGAVRWLFAPVNPNAAGLPNWRWPITAALCFAGTLGTVGAANYAIRF